MFRGHETGIGQDLPLPKRILRFFLQTIFFPFWLLGQLATFLFLSWTTTRDGKAALVGFIPLSGIVFIGGITFAADFLESRLTKAVNTNAANNAELVEEYEEAVLYSRRLQNILSSDSTKFWHAKKLIKAGMVDNGMEIVNDLASPHEAGYIGAHIYLGEKLFNEWNEDRELVDGLELARKHFEWVESKAVDGNHYKSVAQRYIPLIMFEQNDFEEASKRFQQISNIVPGVVPKLAQYLLDNGETELAKRHMDRGLTALDRSAEINPNDIRIWQLKYQILEVTEDYKRIMEELNVGYQLANLEYTKQGILQLQSRALHEFSNNFEKLDDEDSVRRKFSLVIKSLTRNPRNTGALNDLISLLAYPPNDKIRNWVEDEARTQGEPAIGQLILGLLDTLQNKVGTGRMYLRLAATSDHKAATLLNFFCDAMAAKESQLGDALQLANIAIATWSGPPELFKTRAEILLKLDRAEEALVDLEYAKHVGSEDPNLYRAFANCYRNLGRDKEADESQQKCDELEKLQQQTWQEMERMAVER